MTEYIDRKAVEEMIENAEHIAPAFGLCGGYCIDDIDLSSIPAADVAPVVRWISVADKMPDERESIFKKFFGTKNWMNGMCKSMSNKVIVTAKDQYGKKLVVTGYTADGVWKIDCLIPGLIVTHWMPLPEPPEVVKADDIKAIPTADVAPVVHGKWKGYTKSAYRGTDDFGDPIYRDATFFCCSNCDRRTDVKERYCPNCGAKMDLENE